MIWMTFTKSWIFTTKRPLKQTYIIEIMMYACDQCVPPPSTSIYVHGNFSKNIWNMPYHTQVIYARQIIVWANNMWYKIVIFKAKWEHKRATLGGDMEKILERETNQEVKDKRAKKRVQQKKTNCWKNEIRQQGWNKT